MYEIRKSGERLALKDELILVKKNRNGIYVPATWANAEGVVVGNDYVEPITNVEIDWIEGAEQIATMESALNELGVVTNGE